jgi:hypothetical protein
MVQSARAGIRILRDAFETYNRNGIEPPDADFEWFNTALVRGLHKLDDGLIWILGGFQQPPHPHLASRHVIEIFRHSIRLAILISRKMPIHARMSSVLSDMVSLLSNLQDILTTNEPNFGRDLRAACDEAQNVNYQYHAERFKHPWDYATVSLRFRCCLNPSN